MNVLDLAVKCDLPTLLTMYNEAKQAMEKPESLQPEVVKQCEEISYNFAVALRMTAKKLQMGTTLWAANAECRGVSSRPGETID